MSDILDIIAVEPEPRAAKEMTEAFHKADFRFRAVPDARRLLAALRIKRSDAVVVHAELGERARCGADLADGDRGIRAPGAAA